MIRRGFHRYDEKGPGVHAAVAVNVELAGVDEDEDEKKVQHA